MNRIGNYFRDQRVIFYRVFAINIGACLKFGLDERIIMEINHKVEILKYLQILP
jgi:hypothetical protein